MAIVPLTTRLAMPRESGVRWQTDPDGDGNEGWRQFVMDHKDMIMSTAEPVAVSSNVFSEVRFDLTRFFRQQKITPQYIWVTRLLNPNLNDITFDRVRIIYVPDVGTMKMLYQQYKASAATTSRPSSGY